MWKLLKGGSGVLLRGGVGRDIEEKKGMEWVPLLAEEDERDNADEGGRLCHLIDTKKFLIGLQFQYCLNNFIKKDRRLGLAISCNLSNRGKFTEYNNFIPHLNK